MNSDILSASVSRSISAMNVEMSRIVGVNSVLEATSVGVRSISMVELMLSEIWLFSVGILVISGFSVVSITNQ